MKHLFSLILLAGLAAPVVVTAYDVFGPLKPAQVGTSYTVEFNLTALAPVLNGNTNSTFSTASCSASVSSASTAATSTSASSARASSAVDHNGCDFIPIPIPATTSASVVTATVTEAISPNSSISQPTAMAAHSSTTISSALSTSSVAGSTHSPDTCGPAEPAFCLIGMPANYTTGSNDIPVFSILQLYRGSFTASRASLIPVVRLRIDDTELLLALALLTTWVVIAFLISQHQEAPQKPPEKTYGVVEVPHTQHSATPAEGL
ncbi:hypothetical protein NUW54_g5509 [Trametes sanguinea]|uniref:Uncharacterized protein n=1 Tax=Trametes sanguinea TaxID=158606 RepID=A0ACC1PWJ4_9APHY|nr:hypothetical protein NUW54_g5509 [Trametes sanguinea]